MRILHISSAKHFGGGERHLVDLCRGLTARGHEVFAALRPTNKWQAKLDFLPAANFMHVSIRNSFGVFSAKKIAEFVGKNEIDIVHAHMGRDYIPASLACHLAKNAKFILTRHVLFPIKPFYRFALKNLSAAIAVSSAVEANLQRVFSREKTTLIPNGLDVEGVDTEKLREEFRFLHDIPFDALLVGTIGELKLLKGQRDFVLAAQEVAKEFPDARFVIVGKDNSPGSKFRRELKRLVKVFELEERFLWLDWVEDTAPLFAAMDVFVSPSHSESFGLAILEAMASGKAIVATETEGAKELLQDKFGSLVPINDPVGLAGKICGLLDDENTRKLLGEKFQQIARDNFSAGQMINETEKLYRKVLD